LTTFDYPGAVYTDPRGINARGEIVGAYRRSGERPVDSHGFLNRSVRGWAAYFSYGSCTKARRDVHLHLYHAVRRFLRRRHNVGGRGYRQFPEPVVFGKLGVLALASCSRAPLRMP
jgi:hypothetical protein